MVTIATTSGDCEVGLWSSTADIQQQQNSCSGRWWPMAEQRQSKGQVAGGGSLWEEMIMMMMWGVIYGAWQKESTGAKGDVIQALPNKTYIYCSNGKGIHNRATYTVGGKLPCRRSPDHHLNKRMWKRNKSQISSRGIKRKAPHADIDALPWR